MSEQTLHKNWVFRIIAPIFFIVLLSSIWLGAPFLMMLQEVSPESVPAAENLLIWIVVIGILILTMTMIFIMSRKRCEIKGTDWVCSRFNIEVSREKFSEIERN